MYYYNSTMIWTYVIILVVYFILNGVLASKASDVANDKGYEKKKWFHICFWLGPVAYIIIAAMPDKMLREQLSQLFASINDAGITSKESIKKSDNASARKETAAKKASTQNTNSTKYDDLPSL